MARILQFAKRRKYEILLGSLAVLMFGQLLIPDGFDVQAFLMIQNIVAGLLLFSDNNKMRALLLGILFSIVGLEIYAHFYHWENRQFYFFWYLYTLFSHDLFQGIY